MKGKIYFLTVSIIILIFSLTLCFVLNEYYPVAGRNNLILYIVSKCIFSLGLVAIILRGVSKHDVANYVIQYCASVIVQFLPLLIRLLSVLERGFLASIIIFFIALIIYSAIVLAFNFLSDKTRSAEKKLEGKVTEIDEN